MEFVTAFNCLLQQTPTLFCFFKLLSVFRHPSFREREVSQRSGHIEICVKEVEENVQIKNNQVLGTKKRAGHVGASTLLKPY